MKECVLHLQNKVSKILIKCAEDNLRTTDLTRIITTKLGARIIIRRKEY